MLQSDGGPDLKIYPSRLIPHGLAAWQRLGLTRQSIFNQLHRMAKLALALFLIVFGLNLLFGLSLPIQIIGLLALLAGILFLMERFNVARVDRK